MQRRALVGLTKRIKVLQKVNVSYLDFFYANTIYTLCPYIHYKTHTILLWLWKYVNGILQLLICRYWVAIINTSLTLPNLNKTKCLILYLRKLSRIIAIYICIKLFFYLYFCIIVVIWSCFMSLSMTLFYIYAHINISNSLVLYLYRRQNSLPSSGSSSYRHIVSFVCCNCIPFNVGNRTTIIYI